MAEKREKGHAHHLKQLKLGELLPHPLAQRLGGVSQSRVKELAADFDLDAFGQPVVSHEGDKYYVLDGSHRTGAALTFGFAPTDTVLCEVFEGLSPQESARLFLKLNDRRAVGALDKFDKGVLAGFREDQEIDFAVRALGMRTAKTRAPGVISAVNTLRRVFKRHGAVELGRVLRVICDAYGDRALDGPLIDGISLFLHRYEPLVDEAELVRKLAAAPGGLNGLMQPARRMKEQMGATLPQCIAAAAADLFNKGRPKKLPAWWRAS